ncbi:hypothetical protein AB0C52_12760 [Streptomyces sp. NPDC048717]|uniref:hypothetical protein n=1 Tax=Streptomyces sp. NPDC048717 TaxID=3154928 RepID=UPI0034480C82
MTLADGSESFPVADRPTDDDLFTFPLPYGLTLDDAVAIRAREVSSGDLVVALTVEGAGMREVDHCPEPFLASPHSPLACPCEVCDVCEALTDWIMVDPARLAEVEWRYVCLSPSSVDDDCVIEPSARPVIAVRAEVVERARARIVEPQVVEVEVVEPARRYVVAWRHEVEADSPEGAAAAVYGQIRAHLADALPTLWDVTAQGGAPVMVCLGSIDAQGREW